MSFVEKKVVLVTGSTDGIGKGTALELADRGARVLLHGRDLARGEKTVEEMREKADRDQLEYHLAYYNADFSSLEEVKKLARDITVAHDYIDILINNAGVGPGSPENSRKQISRDGHELRFAVNYLAPFLLTHLLLPILGKNGRSRVVNVASAAQMPLDFDDLMLETNYDPQIAYAQSKLALVMFTFSLAERLDKENITVNCLHPGSLLDTKMVRESKMEPQGEVQTGVDAQFYLATSSELDDVTGKYFERKDQARANEQAYDKQAREKLWERSKELVGL